MPVRTRDWLKFGLLVVSASLLGLAFSAALDLPRGGHAAEVTLAPGQAPTQTPPIPSARGPAESNVSFVAVVEHVKPAVVYIQARHTERATRRRSEMDDFFRRLPPGWEDIVPQFQFPDRPRVEQGSGTGFIVSADGYILTNHHVVAGADRVTVKLPDNREFPARVVGSDEATDVAVIKVEAPSLPSVTLGNSDSTKIGEWVLAIGNPLGENFQFTVTAGIVSARGRRLPGLEQVPGYSIQDFLQTDAAINPGNSGGPLVNLRGEVIGINSAIASATGFYSGYGFAIPMNLARAVMDQIVRNGRVRRAVMGVSIRPISPEDAEAVGLRDIRGVVVDDYTNDDSPAKTAGIKPGDVIVALDGKPIEYVAQLQQSVAFKQPGDLVRVEVVRQGSERRTVSVRLAEVPAPPRPLASRDAGDGGTQPATAEERKLGISVDAMSQVRRVDRATLQATGGDGLVVTAVSPDGPAWNKLFDNSQGAPPDVILSVNGTAVRTRDDLVRILRGVRPGEIVTLQVYTPAPQGEGRRRVVRIRAAQ